MNKELSLILYIICFIISSFLLYKGKKTKSKTLILISLIIPIFLAGFRYHVGTDFDTYLWLYKKYSPMEISNIFTNEVEISFIVICKIAKLFNYPRLIFFIYAIITTIFSYAGINKLSNKDPNNITWMFFVFLFNFYITSFNIMRQVAAIAICIYALYYIVNRKFLKYLILILLAFTFHKSAIVMLPLYFIYDKKRTVKKQFFVCLLVTIVIANFDNMFSILTGIEMFEKYSIYNSTLESGNKTLILNIIFILIFLFEYKKLYAYNNNNKFFLTSYIIGTIISVIGLKSPFLKRVASFFLISLIFLISDFICTEKNAKNRLLKIVITIILIIGPFILSTYVLGQADLLPYRVK